MMCQLKAIHSKIGMLNATNDFFLRWNRANNLQGFLACGFVFLIECIAKSLAAVVSNATAMWLALVFE